MHHTICVILSARLLYLPFSFVEIFSTLVKRATVLFAAYLRPSVAFDFDLAQTG